MLAELCRRDLVAAIWLATPRVRAERERARFRLHLVRHRTALKARIHQTLIAFGVPCPVSGLFGHRGRLLLERLALPEPWLGDLQASLRLIDDLDRQIALCESGSVDRRGPLALSTHNAPLEFATQTPVQRSEMAFVERLSKDGGFVFVAFSAVRWFSRASVLLTSITHTVRKHDVRVMDPLDDASRHDLTREVKQALYRLNLLYRKMAKLIAQLPEQETGRPGPRQHEQDCQPRDVPQCHACAKMTRAQPHFTHPLRAARTRRRRTGGRGGRCRW